MAGRLAELRDAVRAARHADEASVVRGLLADPPLDPDARARCETRAMAWVERLRGEVAPTLMESFLAEYGLSTQEGVALMCLAEAYLRVPDPGTLDALIRDKIGSGQWTAHLRGSRSSLVNASSWALMLTGRMVAGSADDTVAETVRRLVQRVGEPLVRAAVAQAMKVLGRQFVRGRDIDEAIERGAQMRAKGYRYSYDMLGEAARTADDARRYFHAYSEAIQTIARHADAAWVHDNPGISIKLSALHPRYEFTQRRRVLAELLPRVAELAELARHANIGFTVDAEEADRLDPSLDLVEALLDSADLGAWEGFGVVVQAYSKQARPLLAWLAALAERHGRRIAVRLVKGAYWDSEIRHAQLLGLSSYPVFTRKATTDLAYLACARDLVARADLFYPQFATHNAHTVAAVLELTRDLEAFELQRLHGMGEALHERVREATGCVGRIYAPVGVHRDLLAYLVRRLLENGANSSFVHRLLDTEVASSELVADPVARVAAADPPAHPRIALPTALYAPTRRNARGWNLADPVDAAALDAALAPYATHRWHAGPSGGEGAGAAHPVRNPARPDDIVGEVIDGSEDDARAALERAAHAFPAWRDLPADGRAACIARVADLYEAHAGELLALLVREAGKTRLDAVLELREAVDFCRYYAARAATYARVGRGPFVCISPWNFPLAIFTGQVVAALVAGNSVVAKPAAPTPLVAARAVSLMHEAGVPREVLHLVPGPGSTVGAILVGDPRTAGVCFTGSTATAIGIDRALAGRGDPRAPLIAETGGLNAMLVDSTALPEHAVRDIVASAFQSAGQRCSALRILCLQRDVADDVLAMLDGALRELAVGDPWEASTDVGPVIDATAAEAIETHCASYATRGRRLFRHPRERWPAVGHFVAPTVLRLERFDELTDEVFGPVLHVLTYAAEELDEVVDAINASGYGLTLGLHSRVGERVDRVCARARVGNIYVNRNQIGAVVGVQPFGGEGLSGTGPKAGGPHYLARFGTGRQTPSLEPIALGVKTRSEVVTWNAWVARAAAVQPGWDRDATRAARLAAAVDRLPSALQGPARAWLDWDEPEQGRLPGPTGERNTLALHGRGLALCLGGGTAPAAARLAQAICALAAGNAVALVAGADDAVAAALRDALLGAGIDEALFALIAPVSADALRTLPRLGLVAIEGADATVAAARRALAARDGPRVPLVALAEGRARFATERVISVDTTASGGNTALLTLDE